jgi:protein-disulfide isomerase
MVARCGGPTKYFGISDMLYTEQRDWLASNDPTGISDALRKIGLKAGLTKEAIDTCLNDNDMAKAMVAVYQTNATNDKIEGTPSFLINGERHSGEMSYEEFAKLIDAELAK